MREPDWQSEDGSIRLYRGDCLEVMPDLTETVDAVICDLPYGTTSCKWDAVIPFAPLWEAYKRAIKPKGAVVLFGSQPFTSALVMSNLRWFKYQWVWHKPRPTGFQNAKKQPLRCIEDVLVFGGASTYNPQGVVRVNLTQRNSVSTGGASARGDVAKSAGKGKMRTAGAEYVQEFSNYPSNLLSVGQGGESKLHPTQKPVALLEYLVKTYTTEGDTVLDNTFGSGTTAVACINTGRKFIGIERDPDYFNIAVKRCEDALATRQGSLFPNDEAPVAV